MEIWNKEEMENFRDRVNSGRTYEGRTVKVDGKEIELSLREYELLKYLVDNEKIALIPLLS